MAAEIATDAGAVDAVLAAALAASKADETEVLYSASNSALTRYTNNEIHENMIESNHALNVRAVVGKQIGVASTNRLDPKGVREAVARATEIARRAPADERFPGLPSGGGDAAGIPDAYDAATAQCGPELRAEAVGCIAGVMKQRRLNAAGFVATRNDAIAVANSKGVRRFFRGTDASVNIKAIGDDSSGYAEGFSRSFSDLDMTALAERAAQKALAGHGGRDLEPGAYTVVLEAPAFREFLGYLSWVGFGAQPLDEGSSFMAGRIGQRVMGANVTIRDDWTHPAGDGFPFDFEGVPRRPVTLIENGIAKGVVYDSYYAAKTGHPNTGHALPAPNSQGPLPLNVLVEPGTRSLPEIIAGVKRGVLVTRTWYIRLVDQKKVIITGMTRDGLFMIENGAVTHGLKNMRFNESIVDALGRCELARELVRSESHVLPAVRIDGFHFSSGTTFG